MGFIANLTFFLSAASAGLLKASSLRSDAYYGPLKERIRLEQQEYNTCQNCFRDYAYVQLKKDPFRSAESQTVYRSKRNRGREDTTYKCKYCGHTKVVNKLYNG